MVATIIPGKPQKRPQPHVSPFLEKKKMANLILADDQQLPLSLVGTDDQGNPTGPLPAGATAVWSTSDPAVLTVAPDPANPLAALVKTTGKLGTGVQVSVSVTLAGATAPIMGVLPIDVVPSAMVSVAVQPGTPAPRA
jgi:hypothetical protein